MAISRRRRLLSIFAMFLSVALLATGCAKEEPKPTPTPTKTAIFSSEEAALQAALSVYQKYTAAYEAITASGEADFSGIEEFVTDEFYEYVSSDTSFVEQGIHTEGSSTFDTASLVSLDKNAKEVVIKLCRDVSSVKVLDEAGADASPENRQYRFPYKVSFVAADDDVLLVSDTAVIPDDVSCSR
ncbi:hypothetical protein ACSAGD_10435 [Paramicrobacterium sp. CJ85]|uniref:hypothetical protein n=1 Tax=Paramicrobacterium sp. CJ85 TaxID=3445355 RepID=UPI003F5D7C67